MASFNKNIKRILLGILFFILLFLYKTYNPSYNSLFPKCPFLTWTGLKCPGCGSQRAIHHILNFNIKNAAHENLLAVIFIPYIIIGYLFEFIKNPSQKLLKWREILIGRKAILFILVFIISFWIYRNIKLHYGI